MPRQHRSPRAVRVAGGRWFRPPRPKPRRDLPHHEEDDEKVGEQQGEVHREEEGYESCERFDSAVLTEVLLDEAQCLEVKDVEVGSLLQALCRQLEKNFET